MGIRLIVAAQERWPKGLNGNEYKLLMLLCEQANDHTCQVWPEFEKGETSTVFRRFGGSRTAIYKALSGLVEKGAVGRVKHGQKNQNAVLRVLAPVEGPSIDIPQGPENRDAETALHAPQGPENRDAEGPSGSRFLSLRVPKTGTPSPQSPNPSPPTPRTDVAVVVPKMREGGEEIDEETNITVARVRELKPAWSSKKIRQVLMSPEVRERGDHEVARTALLIVAADKDSRYPTRVLQDGPWWDEALKVQGRAQSAVPARCDDPRHDQNDPHAGRMLEEDGRIWPCPNCHPKFFLANGDAR